MFIFFQVLVFFLLGGPCIMFEGKSWTAETKAKLEDLTIPISTKPQTSRANDETIHVARGIHYINI